MGALFAKGISGSSAGKESASSVGDLGSVPGLGRSPGEGNSYPLQYSGLENTMDCIVHGVAKSRLSLSFHLKKQYSWTFQRNRIFMAYSPHQQLRHSYHQKYTSSQLTDLLWKWSFVLSYIFSFISVILRRYEKSLTKQIYQNPWNSDIPFQGDSLPQPLSESLTSTNQYELMEVQSVLI